MKYVVLPLLVIMVGFALWYSFVGYEGVHYKGETAVTDGQFVQVMSGHYLNREYNFITISDNGETIFTYDFYMQDGEDKYPYLQETPGGVLDTPLFYVGWRSLKEVFSGYFGIITIVLLVAGGIFIYFSKKKPRIILCLFRRLRIAFQRWRFRNVEDAQGNVLADVGSLNVNGSKGIICVRSWDVDNHGTLKSVVMDTEWESNELEAQEELSRDGFDGINAYRLGALVEHQEIVMGIVELDGEYNYHPDGVVRAEHCKILGLFLSKGYRKLGNYLSYKYRVPVFFDDTPIEGYQHWLYSDNGLRAFRHNHEILKEVRSGNGD